MHHDIVEMAVPGDHDLVLRRHLGIDDIGAGSRAGTGDDREQARMVRGEHRDLGDRAAFHHMPGCVTRLSACSVVNPSNLR